MIVVLMLCATTRTAPTSVCVPVDIKAMVETVQVNISPYKNTLLQFEPHFGISLKYDSRVLRFFLIFNEFLAFLLL